MEDGVSTSYDEKGASMENNSDQPDPEIESKIKSIQSTLADYPGLTTLEDRKVCDENLRNFISNLASEFLHLVGTLETFLAQHPENAERARASEAWRQIETLVDKMQSTPYAYSPFFMFDRVPNNHQKNLLENDEDILRIAGEIKELLAPTLGEDTDFGALLDSVVRLAAQLDAQLEARINTIMEFS